jgi:PHD/YefM family antitoxin component YafN of YafNO toxin-antitoxin module
VDRIDTASFEDFRENLTGHMDRIKRDKRPTLIVRRGKASVVVVESADFEAYAKARASMELLQQIERGRKAVAEGKAIPWKKARAELLAGFRRRLKRAGK